MPSIFPRLATAAVLLLASAATVTAGPVSCSGDPCADTNCRGTGAAATAYGSEYSHSVATAAGKTDREVKSHGGRTFAEMKAGYPREADAKAKKDWSWKEMTAACSRSHANVALLLGEADPEGFVAFPHPEALSVGCTADDRIVAGGSLAGRLYLDGAGVYLFDAARGVGMAVQDLELQFNGGTLQNLVPLDVTGMSPTNVVVTLDVVDTDARSGCSATMLY